MSIEDGILKLTNTYNMLDFFPDCLLPEHKDQEPHQHILPKQWEILTCNTKFLYCQGGVGSAKTLPLAIKSILLSLDIPENRGLVGRRDYPLLFDTTWLEVKNCLKRLVEKKLHIDELWYRKYMLKRKTQGDYTIIEFENGSILQAFETKNILRGLGGSYGFFLIDDGMESNEEIFIGDKTNAGLISRLRLPHVAFHKDKENNVLNRLHGMVATNPPPVNHWLHKIFGKSEGVHKIGDDEVTWIHSSTTDNPFTGGASYAKTIISFQHKAGRDENTIRRVIHGESIPAYEGKPVFPQFDHKRHVGRFKFDPNIPLIDSWDFGFIHPAITFSHIYTCKYGTPHYITLSEIANAFSVSVYELYDNYYLDHVKAYYKKAPVIYHSGDRAGFRSSSSNKDKRGDGKILVSEYNMSFVHRYFNLQNSLQFMRMLLNPKHNCKCGMELILIDQLNCPVLIGALEGGYRLPVKRTKTGEIAKEKPIEDTFFADVACAWRYGGENFIRFGLPYTYGHLGPSTYGLPTQDSPWDWMMEKEEVPQNILT